MKLEIERKFIVSSLPKKEPDNVFNIEQFYIKNEKGICERARTYHSDTTGDLYIHTVKKSISKAGLSLLPTGGNCAVSPTNINLQLSPE